MNRKFVLLLLIFLLLTGCGLGQDTAVSLPPLITQSPTDAAEASLTAVANTSTIPVRDLVTLVNQTQDIAAARVAQTEPTPYAVGDTVTFWFKNLAAETNEQIPARLAYRSDMLNMWVQADQRIKDEDVAAAAQFIEQKILPTNHAYFGQEWTPGVDGDPRINILHIEELGGLGIAYFSSADEYVTAVNPYSNQREMLYVSLKDAKLGSDRYFATVAHEIQHMIQWHVDKNEDAWLNEGLSELAVHVNGFATNREKTYAQQTDVQLTNLRQDADVVAAHYAASFLFTAYFRDRFGEAATQTLVQHPENGAAGFTAVLDELAVGLSFDDLFADWLVANYLQSVERGTAPYAYTTIALPELDVQPLQRPFLTSDVHQYGADYWQLSGDTPVTLVFTGTQQVHSIDTTAHSGSHFWLSFPADESDMHLTRPFDLSGLDKATLTFWTWYDIEAGWDYGYVAVSTDAGDSWTLLETAASTADNPEGNNLGVGYTGYSGGGAAPTWTQQTADLTPFVGQPVLVRFQYVTDSAVHWQGFAVDDIAIPELGYQHDAETDDDDWEAAGFVRLTDMLPQHFLVQLILLGDEDVRVQPLQLDEKQRGEWVIPFSETYNKAIIVIAGSTPFTQQTAVYAYEVR
ncbi:MAG: immune inhibitor A [Ardenticatenaceae bacterium]|nr:immune inhibitor A [Ardenticatenaceae bacterium]